MRRSPPRILGNPCHQSFAEGIRHFTVRLQRERRPATHSASFSEPSYSGGLPLTYPGGIAGTTGLSPLRRYSEFLYVRHRQQ